MDIMLILVSERVNGYPILISLFYLPFEHPITAKITYMIQLLREEKVVLWFIFHAFMQSPLSTIIYYIPTKLDFHINEWCLF